MATSKIQKSANKDGSFRYHATIPAELMLLMQWEKGTKLLWERQGKNILVIREMPKLGG